MDKNVNFTEEDIAKCEELYLNSSILNSEANLFKININGQDKVLKKFFNCDLDNKLFTINKLIQNRDFFDERFVIPERVAYLDDFMVGYIMRYVDNYNLSDILNSNEYSISFKKDLLRQIGNILLYADKIRNQNKELSNFYIGDLHVNNFMYDKESKILTVCDLDSCKISPEFNFPSLYLLTSPSLSFMSKYPLDINGDNVINSNTDIFCYIILILNFLYGGNVQKMGLTDYYNYLEYLKKNGLSSGLYTLFYKIYSEDDNINPVDLIDAIPDDISKFHKSYCKFIRKN